MPANLTAVSDPGQIATVNPQVAHASNPKHTEIYKTLRQSTAMVSGMEALAVRALETGETTEQTLESIADLAASVYQQLSLATLAINELSGS